MSRTTFLKHSRSRALRGAVGLLVAGAAVAGLSACGVDSAPAPGASGDNAAAAGFDSKAPLAKLVPEKYQKKGVLTVGTQPDFEPANYTPAGETQIKGYNVDLMQAMADQLGLPVKWEKVPFDQLLIGMQSKKFDVAIAGMTDRKQRQEQVDFIDYQWAGTVLMVAKGNPKNIGSEVNEGCGIKIGDVKGSDAGRLVDLMAAACIKEGKPPTELVSFPSGSDKNLALTSGRVDAMFWPDLAVNVLLRETGDVLDSIPANFEQKVYLGMTFNKEETGLRDAFLAALKAIHENGEYGDILKKWKVEVINLDEPGINLAKS